MPVFHHSFIQLLVLFLSSFQLQLVVSLQLLLLIYDHVENVKVLFTNFVNFFFSLFLELLLLISKLVDFF
jgi:hypothetical protein